MSLKAVFLDVGSTLVREKTSRAAIYADVAAQHGRRITEKAMARTMRTTHDEMPASLPGAFRYSDAWFRAYIHRIFCINLGFGPQAVSGIADELFERFEAPQSFELYAGVTDLLELLKSKGLKLGVISNWSERLPKLLDALELSPFFDTVVCSAIEGLEKPQPEIFHAALEKMNTTAATALHAGDHPIQDGSAQQVGMDCILVDHHQRHVQSELPRVESMHDLGQSILRKLAP